jgi:NADP-dependent 3-hydroxy acid dehydrogenase YdfG
MARYDLNGRAIPITGATGGLGSAVAVALRQRGAGLALKGRDTKALSRQAHSLGGEDVARSWQIDVRDYDSLSLAMAEAARHFGRLDIASNKA